MSDVQNMPDTEIELHRTHRVTMDRRDLLKGLAAGSVVALSGCAYNAEIGRNQLMLVSDDQLAAMAGSIWTQTLRQEPVSRDRSKNNRIERLGANVVSAAGLGNRYDWEFAVIDSPTVNAFAMPGGKVAFYSGILDLMADNDEAAVVMGHEVGHVAARHSAERYSQQIAAGIGMTAVAVALEAGDVQFRNTIAGVLGAGVTFGLILPYSRQHEYEADRLGLRYMTDAGYRPNAALSFWRKMAADGPRVAEFMSTHPSDANRIAAMQQEILVL